MKRPRKPAAPCRPGVPPGVSKDVTTIAETELEAAYRGFVTDTATEDPKRFLARLAAAREALEHLNELRGISGAAATPPEPSAEELIAEARARIADENKS